MAMHTMTEKMRRFFEEYEKDKNPVQAALRAGYSPRSAASTAKKLLKRVESLSSVDQAVSTSAASPSQEAPSQLDRNAIVQGLLLEATTGEQQSSRIKAWELLAKHLGLLSEKSAESQAMTVTFDIDLGDSRHERRHD
ncbi:terminase small subunit [Desulfovibrio inopinatus]|uniref:terminase small subunit n=1 Tax=Desulfovibrio inopinatus TaxID=102109 RepID=UPI0009FFDE1F|nr:terminase small subunit [Desulfovibrio inopinatus]